ncbi:MAG: 5-formyltetrahydrofolate cyclo-ligase [Desulfonatronovibrio sp.]
MTKQEYRKKMMAQRSRLDAGQVESKSRKITERFLDFPGVEDYLYYLAYLPVNKEVDTRFLVSLLLDQGRKVYVPRCHTQKQGRMDFYRITGLEDLKPGYCGIDEPCPDASDFFINQGQTLCILPGLAFDRQGCRLGYGQGFFDRYLKSLPGPRPLLIGFAYDFQVVNHLPADEWDVPVDIIITEKAFFKTRS